MTVLAGQHRVVAILHLPGLRGTRGNHLDHGLHVETGGAPEVQTFRKPLHHARDADLVDHLGELPGTRRADQARAARIGTEHRLDPGKIFRTASGHHREDAFACTGLATGYRRIDKADRVLRSRALELAGETRGGRGVIDQHRAGLHRGEQAVFSEHHLAHALVIAETAEHRVRTGRGPRRSRARFATVFGDPAP